jgi:hypothetical protein
MSTDDLARTTFIESSKVNASDLPEELLLQIYEIQKKYQYEEKRDLALREIEQIIQTYIENK